VSQKLPNLNFLGHPDKCALCVCGNNITVHFEFLTYHTNHTLLLLNFHFYNKVKIKVDEENEKLMEKHDFS